MVAKNGHRLIRTKTLAHYLNVSVCIWLCRRAWIHDEHDTPATVSTLSAQRLHWFRVPGAALDPGRALLAIRSTHQVLAQLWPATSDAESLTLRAVGLEAIMRAFAGAIGFHTPKCGEYRKARWAMWWHLRSRSFACFFLMVFFLI